MRLRKLLEMSYKNWKDRDWKDIKSTWREGIGQFNDEYGAVYTYLGNKVDIGFEFVLSGKIQSDNIDIYECYLAHSELFFASNKDMCSSVENGLYEIIVMPYTTIYLTREEIEKESMLLGMLDDVDLLESITDENIQIPETKKGLTVPETSIISKFRKDLILKVSGLSLRIFQLMDVLEENDDDEL